MKERPILVKGPMVRAILEGRKTQTRRVVKPQPEDGTALQTGMELFQRIGTYPWGQPGDLLWVRETHCFRSTATDIEVEGKEDLPTDGRPYKNFGDYSLVPIYQADEKAELSYDDDPRDGCRDCEDGNPHGHWRPSIFLPRWACRIVLQVKSVRIERLHCITEDGAKAEGADKGEIHGSAVTYRNGFKILWDSINEKRGFGWDKNPFVWVIEFERVPNNTKSNQEDMDAHITTLPARDQAFLRTT